LFTEKKTVLRLLSDGFRTLRDLWTRAHPLAWLSRTLRWVLLTAFVMWVMAMFVMVCGLVAFSVYRSGVLSANRVWQFARVMCALSLQFLFAQVYLVSVQLPNDDQFAKKLRRGRMRAFWRNSAVAATLAQPILGTSVTLLYGACVMLLYALSVRAELRQRTLRNWVSALVIDLGAKYWVTGLGLPLVGIAILGGNWSLLAGVSLALAVSLGIFVAFHVGRSQLSMLELVRRTLSRVEQHDGFARPVLRLLRRIGRRP
jgi:hypothetical protein